MQLTAPILVSRGMMVLQTAPATYPYQSATEDARMGRADTIEAEFPPGVAMPTDLRRLCDYLDCTDYPISGHMRLRPEGGALKAWFGGDTEAVN